MAEQLGISSERVGSILLEDLGMWKLSAKWVPKCLNVNQKRQRCQFSEQILEFFLRDPNDFLLRLLTMDETWLYHYDPETKQQSMEWRHSGSLRLKKFRVQKSAWKFRSSNFSDQDGILLIDHLPKRPNYQRVVLTNLCWCNWRTFWRKNAAGKYQGALVFARQGPGSPGTCNPKETGLPGLPCLDHSPHSPDLTPSEYYFFPGLKNIWKVAIFRPTQKSLLSRRPVWTDRLPNFFFSGLQKLEQGAMKCTELRGAYIE